MTPKEASERMRKIKRRARHHPDKASAQAIELLCKIARKTGFYRSAEIFEKMHRGKGIDELFPKAVR